MVSKALSANRPHKLMVKLTGKRDTGNPYVAFDVAGAGNDAINRASSRPYVRPEQGRYVQWEKAHQGKS